MSIYTDLINCAQNGKRFKIILDKKNLSINGKNVVIDGNAISDSVIISNTDLQQIGINDCLNNCWDIVKDLYLKYEHSCPHESCNGDKSYFKPLPFEELSDAELAYNDDRYLCQALLEGYLLLASLNGNLKWEFGSNWFWQDKSNKHLIVLKNWII